MATIVTTLKMNYRARCEWPHCGARGPKTRVRGIASTLAAQEGWKEVVVRNDWRSICPKCYRAHYLGEG